MNVPVQYRGWQAGNNLIAFTEKTILKSKPRDYQIIQITNRTLIQLILTRTTRINLQVKTKPTYLPASFSAFNMLTQQLRTKPRMHTSLY